MQHADHTSVASRPGKNLTGVAVQCTTQNQKSTTQIQNVHMAIFNIKICYCMVFLIPISSKLEFFCCAKF